MSEHASPPPIVSVIMGSRNDWETMKAASEILDLLGIVHERRVVSAHRTPLQMMQYASSASHRGLKVIIAGAGGAAHLPGMVASETILPVIGVPIQSRALQGLDSLLSIVQMPGGIPVATMAIGTAAQKTPRCWPPESWRWKTKRCEAGSSNSSTTKPTTSWRPPNYERQQWIDRIRFAR